MSVQVFLEEIPWPNGKGGTPCTPQYKECYDRMMLIVDKYSVGGHPGSLDRYSPEDYQRYNELSNALGILQADGHLGKGAPY